MHSLRVATYVVMAAALMGAVSCSELTDTVEVGAHPDGWAVRSSGQFHGEFVLQSASKSESCTTCHGQDYQGGTSGVSCMTSGCHAAFPHPEEFLNPQSGDFHGVFIAQRVGWDLGECQSCHGADYAGNGVESKNCLTCHNQENGPEACNTCHGSSENSAPPEDLIGNRGTNFITVGAHQVHLREGSLALLSLADCAQCHVVPEQFSDPGHIDGDLARAEVVFGSLASQNGRQNPVWDHTTGSCSDVYCHGAFSFPKAESTRPEFYTEDAMTGNSPEVVWTEIGTGQTSCGSCHGNPPVGHVTDDTQCFRCHARVVDPGLNIIDKSLHIDGRINVFGNTLGKVDPSL